MSDMTYNLGVPSVDKPLVWLKGEIKTPPFSQRARLEAGYLLRRLQQGQMLGMPHSRPLLAIGPRCHELRINDERVTWRIVYRIDSDAIIILEVFGKKSRTTPEAVIDACKKRTREYDNA
jgi:phage-related protein